MTKTTYTHWIPCPNCSYKELHYIPKGTTIRSYKRKTNCSNCGCSLSGKCDNPVIPSEQSYGFPGNGYPISTQALHEGLLEIKEGTYWPRRTLCPPEEDPEFAKLISQLPND